MQNMDSKYVVIKTQDGKVLRVAGSSLGIGTQGPQVGQKIVFNKPSSSGVKTGSSLSQQLIMFQAKPTSSIAETGSPVMTQAGLTSSSAESQQLVVPETVPSAIQSQQLKGGTQPDIHWEGPLTNSLLSLMEANLDVQGRKVKKGDTYWRVIAEDFAKLISSPGVKPNSKQCQWRWNALIKSYNKQKKEVNSTGYGHITGKPRQKLLPEDLMERIAYIQGERRTKAVPTLKGTNLNNELQDLTPPVARGTEEEVDENEEDEEPQDTAQPHTSTPKQRSRTLPKKKVRKAHGSGSRFAQARIDLEQKYTTYIDEQKLATASRLTSLQALAESREKSYQLKLEKFMFKKNLAKALLEEKRLDRALREKKLAADQERNRVLTALLPNPPVNNSFL